MKDDGVRSVGPVAPRRVPPVACDDEVIAEPDPSEVVDAGTCRPTRGSVQNDQGWIDVSIPVRQWTLKLENRHLVSPEESNLKSLNDTFNMIY